MDRLHVRAGPLSGGSALVRDYLAGADLGAFYAGHPDDPASFARKADEVQRRLGATSRNHVASAIRPLGSAGPALQRILDGDGFFVTTGQQPALFGGPLYTLYKILSAVTLAERLEAQLGVPVLALFWVGSDDHDWDEANHTVALDGAWYPQRITVAASDETPPMPMSHRAWGDGINAALHEFAPLLAADRLGPEVMEHVRSAYTPTSTVAASFTRTIEWLLRDQRLAVVDAADPLMRQAAVPVLLHEVAHAAQHIALLQEQTRRLEERGYHAQVAIADDASNLMRVDAHGRDRLMLSGGDHWRTRRERNGFSGGELSRLIETEPGAFSPNVLLRPVVESALLPTIAYVAGPGETAYYAQLGGLYSSHGILPPVVVPRASVTIVEPRVAALLERTGTTLHAALSEPLDALVRERLRRDVPPGITAALDRLRNDIEEGYARLTDAADAVDPTLTGPLRSARNESLMRARDAERRILTQMRRRNGELVGQLRRISASLRPAGAPQERVLGPLPFVARHGRELVADISAAVISGWPVAPPIRASAR